MHSEITSLLKNKTFSLVPETNAINVSTAKWTSRINNIAATSGGNEYPYKATLAAREIQQINESYFEENSAPVISFSALRLFLPLAAEESSELHQIDVDTPI